MMGVSDRGLEGLSRTHGGGKQTDKSKGAEEGISAVERKTHDTIILWNGLWDVPTQLLRRWPRIG
jgi:hypothetical protein